MIFHPMFAILTSFLNTLYGFLPSWNFTFGTGCFTAGCTPTGDGGAAVGIIQYLIVLDRFIPVHDALIPILTLQLSITAGLLIFKAIKFVLSLIPTVSASG